MFGDAQTLYAPLELGHNSRRDHELGGVTQESPVNIIRLSMFSHI